MSCARNPCRALMLATLFLIIGFSAEAKPCSNQKSRVKTKNFKSQFITVSVKFLAHYVNFSAHYDKKNSITLIKKVHIVCYKKYYNAYLCSDKSYNDF